MTNETWSICTCPMGYRPKGYREAQRVTVCFGDAQEKTARLIAAAPDMLALLESIERSLPLIDLQSCGYLAGDIRAAIAKAKGEVT